METGAVYARKLLGIIDGHFDTKKDLSDNSTYFGHSNLSEKP